MAVSFNINIDKIIFTSPNMPSPSSAGTRSHIIYGEMNLGTWYEQGALMNRAALEQNIFDTATNPGINRPIFGYSGIIASGTQFIENQTNYIYVYTEDTWGTSVPFNLYIDDNSWFEVTTATAYEYADDPDPAPALLMTNFTSSGTLTPPLNIILNGSICYYNNLNYIFNTEDLYSFNNITENYTHLSSSQYKY
jgi:hypothetical protein